MLSQLLKQSRQPLSCSQLQDLPVSASRSPTGEPGPGLVYEVCSVSGYSSLTLDLVVASAH